MIVIKITSYNSKLDIIKTATSILSITVIVSTNEKFQLLVFQRNYLRMMSDYSSRIDRYNTNCRRKLYFSNFLNEIEKKAELK